MLYLAAFLPRSIQKAIDIVKTAIEEDTKQNYQEAYRQYQNALDYFMMAMKCESYEKWQLSSDLSSSNHR